MLHPHSKNGVKGTNFIVLPLLACLQPHLALAICFLVFQVGASMSFDTFLFAIFEKGKFHVYLGNSQTTGLKTLYIH